MHKFLANNIQYDLLNCIVMNDEKPRSDMVVAKKEIVNSVAGETLFCKEKINGKPI